MDDKTRRVIEQVEKLLRLAGRNTNEAEAASATAKAMELLAAHNLDMSVVDENSDGGGRRAEEKLHGGFYEFEQSVWRYVADLNFCIYWHQKTWVERPANQLNHARVQAYQDHWRRKHILRGQHRLVGRAVNVAMTKAMAEYLLQTIERLTRERLGEVMGSERINTQMRSRWAVSFREGIAQRIVEKLWARRTDIEQQEEAKKREAEARAAMAGASVETGLTIAAVRKSERDANMDFLYGEGWSAKQAAEAARRAEAQRRAEEEYTRWAAEHPEEAAKQEAEARAEERRRSERSSRRSSDRAEKVRDWSAYRAGYQKGESVGIDPQADGGRTAGRLSHG